MSEPQNHQEMVDSIKKLIDEIDREIDRKIDQDVELDQLHPLALLATAITNLCAAGAVLEYIDGKISGSSLINTLDTSISGDLIAITCLKKATQENKLN
ncbi:hypothetical protein [Sutterella wadsworthensis]|uniref:hypothetical protein n=1 Tax=Sutterella wadsworthensis TaxID=40545 RepID=UPI0013F6304A|nr:hypothetical protein [Sutterella wadsworthensis]